MVVPLKVIYVYNSLFWGSSMIFLVNDGSMLKPRSSSYFLGAWSASICCGISRSFFSISSFRVGQHWGEAWPEIESLLKIKGGECLSQWQGELLGQLWRLAPALRLWESWSIDLPLAGYRFLGARRDSLFCCIPLTIAESICTYWIRLLYWSWEIIGATGRF